MQVVVPAVENLPSQRAVGTWAVSSREAAALPCHSCSWSAMNSVAADLLLRHLLPRAVVAAGAVDIDIESVHLHYSAVVLTTTSSKNDWTDCSDALLVHFQTLF